MDTKKGRLAAPEIVKKYDYWVIFLIAFLYVRWDLLWFGNGLGVVLFALLFCAFVKWRLGTVPQERARAARPWLFVIAASAFQAVWFDYTPVGWVNTVFLSVCAMYWMMILSGRRLSEEIAFYLPIDLLCQMVRVPFANLGRFFGAVFRTRHYRQDIGEQATDSAQKMAVDVERAEARLKTLAQGFTADVEADSPQCFAEQTSPRSKSTVLRNVLWIGFALCFAAPLFLVVLNLLAAADDGFMRLVSSLTDFVSRWFRDFFTVNLAEAILDGVLAIPVAAYLFGALWGNVRPAVAKGWVKQESVDRWTTAMRFVPKLAVYTAMWLFLGAYLLFLLLQAGHLLTACNVGLPHATTYSAFAREGFFELCAVCAINLGILAAVWIFCVREEGKTPRTLRIFSVILSLQTVFLAITAQVKMGLYIQAYGLTRLRIYTTWFMIWLIAVFLLLAAAQLRKIPAAKLLVILSVVMFLILGYADVDALVVRENLARYDDGRISAEELHVEGLAYLSDDAMLELLSYCRGEGGYDSQRRQQLTQEIRRVASDRRRMETQDDWYHWNGGALRLKYQWNQMGL